MLVPGLALLAMLVAAPGPALAGAAAQLPPVTAADRVIGRANAAVTVIEYGSFACPACADWHELVFPAFRQRFIDTGRVRFVFRNLPTQPEAVSVPGAALALCAAPERFFDVASALMRGQAAVLRGGAREDWYAPAVAASGRTLAQLETCAATPATRDAISRDIDGAHAADVHSTPAFFVNGRRVTDRSLGGLEVAIQAAVAGQ